MAALPVVLVHGGGHGAWCWAPMIAHLQHEALAVDLPPKTVRGGPGRFDRPPELLTLTVSDFAASVLADVDAAGIDRFVLVGHSLAGLTIPQVARRAPDRVAHLVFVSCAVPPEGGSVLDILEGDAGDRARVNIDDAQTSEEDGGGQLTSQLPPEVLRAMFCNDMDEAQTQFVLDHFGNEVMGVISEPVSRAGMSPEIPKTWIRLLRDATLSVERQTGNAANLEASPGGTVEFIDLDAAHNAMISRPAELAAIVDSIAAGADSIAAGADRIADASD